MEDGISLFGFLSREDLEIYRMLIGVSGIGPKRRLRCCPRYCRQSALCRPLGRCPGDCQTPGIGKKTAQKLILELKRQIRPAGSVRAEAGRKSGGCGGTAGRRTGCLPGCGTGADCACYSGTEALQAVKKVEITEGMDSEAVLKAALKHMF